MCDYIVMNNNAAANTIRYEAVALETGTSRTGWPVDEGTLVASFFDAVTAKAYAKASPVAVEIIDLMETYSDETSPCGFRYAQVARS